MVWKSRSTSAMLTGAAGGVEKDAGDRTETSRLFEAAWPPSARRPGVPRPTATLCGRAFVGLLLLLLLLLPPR
jgi:hypothetical protein